MSKPSNGSVNLDVLRAIAVSTVLVDHFIPTIDHKGLFANHLLSQLTNTIGHAGVLAFFVHTSLVLMYSLERLERDGQPIVRRFYLRRFFRIYPLAIVCVLAVVLLKIPSVTWKAPEVITGRVIAANLMLVQNVITGKSVIGPLWSLPYEVQMYVVLPALYLLAKRPRALLWLSLLIGAFALLGLVLTVTVGKRHMANYVPCFLAGVLCYALRKKVRPVFPAALWPPFVLAAVASYCLVHLRSSQPIYWVGWIYCLVIGGAVHLFRQPEEGVLSTLSNKVAMYSYGIYLWHVPMLYLLFYVLPPMPLLACIPLFLTLTIGLSILSFHLVEAPMMELGRKRTESG